MGKPHRQIGVSLQTHDVPLAKPGAHQCSSPDHLPGANKDKRPVRTPTGESRQHGEIQLGRRSPLQTSDVAGKISKLAGCRRIKRSREMRLICNIAVVIGTNIERHQRYLKLGDVVNTKSTVRHSSSPLRNQLRRHSRLGMNTVNAVINSTENIDRLTILHIASGQVATCERVISPQQRRSKTQAPENQCQGTPDQQAVDPRSPATHPE